MAVEQITALLQQTIYLALIVASPFLGIAVLLGLGISIFQTVTSINEQTLTFIPKIVGVLGVFGLLFPWIMGNVVDFTKRVMLLIAQQGGP